MEGIYSNATAKIHIENDVSKAIQIEKGFRPGDTISPKMFTDAMEELFKKLNLQDRGLNKDGEKLTDLRFSNDVALITSSVKGMEIQFNDLNKEKKQIGLKIHKGKTKYMTNFQSDETIEIENETIEKVDKYKYLVKLWCWMNIQEKKLW